MTTDRTTLDSVPAAPLTGRAGRRRRAGVAVALAAVVLLVSGCGGGPGDKEDFVDVLMLDDNFNEAQATCIADAVFDEYGEDGDALQKISGADSYEYLIGEDGVEGFGPFFDGVVNACLAVGPSPDDT
jgi:hypothetical protein